MRNGSSGYGGRFEIYWALPARVQISLLIFSHLVFYYVSARLVVMIVACQVMDPGGSQFLKHFCFGNTKTSKTALGGLEPPTPRSEVWCAIHCATKANLADKEMTFWNIVRTDRKNVSPVNCEMCRQDTSKSFGGDWINLRGRKVDFHAKTATFVRS